MKKFIIITNSTGIILVAIFIVLFHSSITDDKYVCHSCKAFGRSTAFRVFRYPVVWTPVRLTLSLTDMTCDHQWEWYFANSHGICFNNRENWDGPIGEQPYHEELEKQTPASALKLP